MRKGKLNFEFQELDDDQDQGMNFMDKSGAANGGGVIGQQQQQKKPLSNTFFQQQLQHQSHNNNIGVSRLFMAGDSQASQQFQPSMPNNNLNLHTSQVSSTMDTSSLGVGSGNAWADSFEFSGLTQSLGDFSLSDHHQHSHQQNAVAKPSAATNNFAIDNDEDEDFDGVEEFSLTHKHSCK